LVPWRLHLCRQLWQFFSILQFGHGIGAVETSSRAGGSK
jgi:hypothetical protein